MFHIFSLLLKIQIYLRMFDVSLSILSFVDQAANLFVFQNLFGDAYAKFSWVYLEMDI